jgi:hypothetical protein
MRTTFAALGAAILVGGCTPMSHKVAVFMKGQSACYSADGSTFRRSGRSYVTEQIRVEEAIVRVAVDRFEEAGFFDERNRSSLDVVKKPIPLSIGVESRRRWKVVAFIHSPEGCVPEKYLRILDALARHEATALVREFISINRSLALPSRELPREQP